MRPELIPTLAALGVYPPPPAVAAPAAPVAGTWAAVSAITGSAAGDRGYVTDVTPGGFPVVWNGTRWMPIGKCRVGHGGLMTGIAPSGTMGNNGAFTFGTALNVTYANCYLYFAAGAISSGSAEGFYYVVMSSTTAGVVYNNTYSAGEPTVPTSPTGFATTGPGAFAGVLTEVALRSYTIPANFMGPTSSIHTAWRAGWNNNASVKSHRVKVAGVETYYRTSTTTITDALMQILQNRGVLNRQIELTNTNSNNSPWNGATTGALAITTINTGNSFTVTITGTLGAATDFVTCEAAYLDIEI